jgi:hypothetical protein
MDEKTGRVQQSRARAKISFTKAGLMPSGPGADEGLVFANAERTSSLLIGPEWESSGSTECLDHIGNKSAFSDRDILEKCSKRADGAIGTEDWLSLSFANTRHAFDGSSTASALA